MKHVWRVLLGIAALTAIVAVCTIPIVQIIVAVVGMVVTVSILVYGIGYALSPDNND